MILQSHDPQKVYAIINKYLIDFGANIDYNIRMKVKSTPLFDSLDSLLTESKGTIMTSQGLRLGISKPTFYSYIKERQLKKVGHGIYVTEDAWIDYMYILNLRSEQAIFSHESALFLLGMTDREPVQYTITVKSGYNPTRLKEDGIKVYTVKESLHEVGTIATQTPFGHSVRAYNRERTICDILRSRRDIDAQTIQDALKQYVRCNDRNLRLLLNYATIFNVEKTIRTYLEVLL